MAKVNDLRSAIELLKTVPGQYIETNEPVDANAELAGVYRYIGSGGTVKRPTRLGPAMMFNNIKGMPGCRSIIGVLASRERVAMLLDTTPDKLAFLLKDSVNNPIPPVVVGPEKAKCQEVVHLATDEGFDVRKIIPAPTNTPDDGGPYITMGLLRATHPVTGETDVTIHRMCLHGNDYVSVFFTPGARHIGAMYEAAEKMGQPLKVSVSIGIDPAIYIASGFEPPTTPMGYDELCCAGAIRGERVKIKIVHLGHAAAYGEILEILHRSPERLDPECPYAADCGGCVFWHMTYEEELRAKARRVQDALERIGGEHLGDLAITGSPDMRHYRNKAQYPVGLVRGKAEAGFFRQRTHAVVPVRRCLIQGPEADQARQTVVQWMQEHRVPVYDERTGKGLVRHIYVRTARKTGQVLVCLVINGDSIPQEKRLVNNLLANVNNFHTLCLSIHKKPGNAVLGDKFVTLFGPGYVEDVLCGLRFRLSPRSFYQVNRDQAERLYEKAITLAGLTGTETVLDLYCGTGTITLALSRAAGRVIGVEIIPAAIRDAKENALRNCVENAEFFCADAGQAAKKFAEEGITPDVIVVAPPRKGLDETVIAAMVQMAPRRIVYVSCDPATLARDLRRLEEAGYRTTHAEAVDMFPRCHHVESVVLLSREKADDKKWAFFENARLLQEAFGITPLLYGSLGLEYLTGKNLNADDIDILIPKAYIAELWHEFTSVLEKNGYTLIDEHEHIFEKGGIHYAYAQIEELESFASIRMSEIATLSAGNLRFKLLSLQQYLKIYTASAKDGYRVEVREKKDFDKIAFIEKQLQTTENVAFPPKRITDESVACLERVNGNQTMTAGGGNL